MKRGINDVAYEYNNFRLYYCIRYLNSVIMNSLKLKTIKTV